VFDLLQVGVDDRSNTLIVRGRDRSLVGKVQNLAASLDVPTPVAGNVHVLYLKNAAASDVAKTLRNILSGDTAAAPTQAGQPGKPAAEGGPGMVQADAASNTLIITAPEAVFTNLKAVVEKLDVRRAQVLVEALIAEISADKAAEFGIQWLYLNRLNSANLSAIGAFGNSSTTSNIAAVAANPIGVAQGLTLGLVHGTINVPGIGEITNLNLLARALKTTTNANILSTPTLLTLDNEEAKMSVGSNVAFATGSFTTPNTVASGNGVVSPFTTFQRQDVGLLLKVRPQISQGGTVRLQISQEVSKLRPAADPTLAQTDKRAIDSTVLVDSGQIVVLGGLIDDQVQDTEDRVPLLGDIPGLGHFFRYTTRQHTKTNLMVFLRPIIVRDAATAAAVTNPRYEYILGLEKASAPPHHVVLPDESSPTLNDSTRPGNVKGPEDKTHATP
jgi:general secretion pathway protein D